jgi:poly(3-hydroxyalkanoate) depolymerase
MTPPAGTVTSVESARGHRLAVSHRPGRADRVPLVLCAGIGSSQDLFDPLVEALAPDRPVVRFDPPGIGTSPPARLPYRIPGLARAVAEIVRRLGYDRFDVLGISWGGGPAQQLAVSNPRRCRRLVLVATGTGALMVPAGPRTLARMLTPRRHRDPDHARRVAGDLYGGATRDDPDAAITALHRAATATPVCGYALQLTAMAGWTSLPFLPAIRQPTLVLAGDDDPLIPLANAAILGALLPHARVHRYRGGHLHLLTHPGTLAPLIDSFLGDASRSTERTRP